MASNDFPPIITEDSLPPGLSRRPLRRGPAAGRVSGAAGKRESVNGQGLVRIRGIRRPLLQTTNQTLTLPNQARPFPFTRSPFLRIPKGSPLASASALLEVKFWFGAYGRDGAASIAALIP